MGHRGEVGARGFTLLELIVVLLVMALVAGLTAPTVGRGTEVIRTRAQVAGFSALLRHTREQAISLRKTHTVTIDATEHRVNVLVADAVVQSRALPAQWVIETTPPAALSLRFDPQGTTSGAEYRIVAGSVIYRVAVDALTGRVRNTRE